jgi:hypothetical protein
MNDADSERSRRQPTEVTMNRLTSHLDEFQDYLTNRDRRAFAQVIAALQDIAEGKR